MMVEILSIKAAAPQLRAPIIPVEMWGHNLKLSRKGTMSACSRREKKVVPVYLLPILSFHMLIPAGSSSKTNHILFDYYLQTDSQLKLPILLQVVIASNRWAKDYMAECFHNSGVKCDVVAAPFQLWIFLECSQITHDQN